METHKKAIGIIADILEMDADTLTSETLMIDIPNWDSLAFLAAIAELDEEFNLEIPIEQVIGELANAKTIGDFLNILGI